MSELKIKRARLIEDVRSLANSENCNSETLQTIERMDQEIANIEKAIAIQEKNEQRYADLKSITSPKIETATTNEVVDVRSTPQYVDTFVKYIKTKGIERAGLQVGTADEGGYLVPTNMSNQIVPLIREKSKIRQLSTVLTITSNTNINTVATNCTSYWKAEEATVQAGEGTFGQVSMVPNTLHTFLRISQELAEDAGYLMTFLNTQISDSQAAAENTAFISGSGTGEPGGILGSAGTAVTTASATAITGDELMNLYHGLVTQYRDSASAAFVMNDSTLLLIRKIKELSTGGNQYLFQPGLAQGAPDRLFGKPIILTSDMPAATATNKSIIFGDFSYYYIADRIGLSVEVVPHLIDSTSHLPNGTLGLYARRRLDANVMQSVAFKVMVQHA